MWYKGREYPTSSSEKVRTTQGCFYGPDFPSEKEYACGGVNAIAAMTGTGVLALELTTSTVTGERRVNLGCRL